MKKLRELDHLRDVTAELKVYGCIGSDRSGVFRVGSMVVIASSNDGWDHVSVSRINRTPTWEEMEQVKRTFFKDDECAFQLHVPVDEYIDGSALGGPTLHCLHLWRPTTTPIPRPPDWMVGTKSQVAEYRKRNP